MNNKQNKRQYVDPPKRLPFSTRVDIKDVTDCLTYFESQGIHIKTQSELISTCVESFAEIIISIGEVERITSNERAMEIINEIGRGRGEKRERAMRILENEDLDIDGIITNRRNNHEQI